MIVQRTSVKMLGKPQRECWVLGGVGGGGSAARRESPSPGPCSPAGGRANGLAQPSHLYFVHELGDGADVPGVLGPASWDRRPGRPGTTSPRLPRRLGSEALTASRQPLLSQDRGELGEQQESSVISFCRKKGPGPTVVTSEVAWGCPTRLRPPEPRRPPAYAELCRL